ncbi:MAG: hypothetical protein RBG13Loki_1498 [Promethearchaeota archaeon CR_4]|nr:MAG: hypothetical protein RBG13Loki_1498 [Candidatus Lokiarchaeota archaeon CR_4]
MNNQPKTADADDHILTPEDANALKMVLGEYGILILVAIKHGAKTRQHIPLVSGVPMACVTGRIPVIINLHLACETEELTLTERGLKFLEISGY